jgi:hypothetical protein
MGVKTAVFINPYLMAIWKKSWSNTKTGDSSKSFSEDDYFEIHEISGIGYEYLKKLLFADTKIKDAKIKTLDKLCVALNSLNPNFQKTWESFEQFHSNNKIFKDCESLKNKKIESKIDKLFLREINKHSRIKAEQFFDENANSSNLPLIDDLFESKDVPSKAELNDIAKIFNFAQNRYGDCPLNGPEIKIPWWEKNNNIFYILHDEFDNVVANINLLPLKHEAYNRIALGQIEEKDITPEDLYSSYEKEKVKHIYVEGLTCLSKRDFATIIRFFPEMMKQLCVVNEDVLIGAIGGTAAGENIMTKMGFDILTSSNQRIDQCNFFQVTYQSILNRYYRLQ